MFQDLARAICLIDVRFDKAASDWITLHEENSSCKFYALQGVKVVRAGSYHTRPENQANDFEKVYRSLYNLAACIDLRDTDVRKGALKDIFTYTFYFKNCGLQKKYPGPSCSNTG